MRSMSKVLASLIGLSLLASAAHAAPERKAPDAILAPVKAALAKLTLTDDQKTKTDAIVKEAEAKVDEMVADAKAEGKKKERTEDEKKAMQTKRQDLAKKFRADIEAVLTPEQKKELVAAIRDARKAAKDAAPAAAAEPAK